MRQNTIPAPWGRAGARLTLGLASLASGLRELPAQWDSGGRLGEEESTGHTQAPIHRTSTNEDLCGLCGGGGQELGWGRQLPGASLDFARPAQVTKTCMAPTTPACLLLRWWREVRLGQLGDQEWGQDTQGPLPCQCRSQLLSSNS